VGAKLSKERNPSADSPGEDHHAESTKQESRLEASAPGVRHQRRFTGDPLLVINDRHAGTVGSPPSASGGGLAHAATAASPDSSRARRAEPSLRTWAPFSPASRAASRIAATSSAAFASST